MTVTLAAIETWAYVEDPEVLTAFVRSARGPEERMERWATRIAEAVACWHETLAAEGYEPHEKPRADLGRHAGIDLFERNLLGLRVTGRVVRKRSRS